MTTAQIVPVLLVPLVLWRVYSRVRRNIGRQPFRPRRLVGASIFFGLIVGLIGFAAARSTFALASLGGGLLLAVPLGWLALRLTKFEASPEGKFYTPNTIIGIGVTLLLVGRVAYRIVTLMSAVPLEGRPPSMLQSPLTLFVFGVTAGYYITYNVGVYLRGKKESASSAIG